MAGLYNSRFPLLFVSELFPYSILLFLSRLSPPYHSPIISPMRTTTLILTLTSLLVSTNALDKRAVAFFNPTAGGGSLLDSVGGGLGEPLNVRQHLFIYILHARTLSYPPLFYSIITITLIDKVHSFANYFACTRLSSLD